MNKATIQQNGKRIYEAMPRAERCKFSDLRTLYHMDSEAILCHSQSCTAWRNDPYKHSPK